MACSTCNNKKCTCKESVVTKYGKSGRNGKGIRGPIGPPGPPGPNGPQNLTISRTAFVSKNGNDSTGLVERLDKPFLTISAATTALNTAFPSRTYVNRVRVFVFDGNYDENIYFQKFIDYYLGNSVINGRVGDNGVDMGSTPSGVWTNIVSGNAKLFNQDTVTAGTLLITKPNTKLLLYCSEIVSDKFEAVAITNGIVRIHCDKIWTTDIIGDYSPAVEMLQGTSDSDYTYSILEIIGADIYMLSGANSSTIQFNDGGASKNQTLSLINCRVKNNNAPSVADGGSSAIAVGVVSNSNAKINLYNTILYSENGKSIYVGAGNTASVYYYHSNMSNVAVGGSGTLTNVLGTSLVVNASVEPGF